MAGKMKINGSQHEQRNATEKTSLILSDDLGMLLSYVDMINMNVNDNRQRSINFVLFFLVLLDC